MFTGEIRKPDIFIEASAKQKMDYLIQGCELEISGLGEVERIGNDFLICNIHLFEQEVSHSETNLSTRDVGSYIYRLIKEGADPSNLKFWWHSHAYGRLFWSFKDMKVIDGFQNCWMISYVGNHAGDYKLRLDIYGEVRLALNNLRLKLYMPEDNILRQNLREEIRQKVKVKKIPILPPMSYSPPELDPQPEEV